MYFSLDVNRCSIKLIFYDHTEINKTMSDLKNTL